MISEKGTGDSCFPTLVSLKRPLRNIRLARVRAIFLFSLFHMLVHEKEIWLWRKTPNMAVARESVVVCILDVKSKLHGI